MVNEEKNTVNEYIIQKEKNTKLRQQQQQHRHD